MPLPSLPGVPVLVTGGAGFIGSHLCERLVRMGEDVLCVDNYFTGTKKNVEHLMNNPLFEVMRHDVTFPLYVEVDQIYNLACPASPIHYQHDPVQTTKTSVLGAINMLGLAKRVQARILQASTSEVYGDPLEHPQVENYRGHVNPIGPRACYDEGKRCAETLCFAYHLERKVPVRIARLFNTYGPRLRPGDGRVVSNFVVQALRGEALTVYGSGQQTRKVKSTIHWVSAADAIPVEVRLYDRLFTVENPNEAPEGKDFTAYLNPNSLEVVEGRAEPSLASAKPGDRYQFERLGYFCVDPDSTPGKPVFNRTVGLRDEWAKLQKA